MLANVFAGSREPPSSTALIIVPPFAALQQPALGPHLLQACARAAGLNVQILYANLALAASIGVSRYRALADQPTELVGERMFAALAYDGVPILGRKTPADDVRIARILNASWRHLDFPGLVELEHRISEWVEEITTALRPFPFPVVGCSTTFEQTAASIALLARVKLNHPETLTIIGGANCEGEMAEGLWSLGTTIDYVFSGESEGTFPQFLDDIRRGRIPPRGIVRGEPCASMDDLPCPDFAEYFQQLKLFHPAEETLSPAATWLAYESSRGCWWGAKKQCTFCGLNGSNISFRAKSAETVAADLATLLRKYPTRNVCMADNIMPYEYFRTLLPQLGRATPEANLFWEQKANLSLPQVIRLHAAGVRSIQPGIESLSSALLRRMQKGVTGGQNIALLRYARSVGISVSWNLLYGFPGDDVSEYEELDFLVPLLVHLQPPSGLRPLIIDRFSPYYSDPARYGVSDIRPWDSYYSVLPDGCDVDKIAYHFSGRFASQSLEYSDMIRALSEKVALWRRRWGGSVPPCLEVTAAGEGRFTLTDTRGLAGAPKVCAISLAEARVALAGTRNLDATETWSALEHRWAVELDGKIIPLATASADLLMRFEAPGRSSTALPLFVSP